MTPRDIPVLSATLRKHGPEILETWVANQAKATTLRPDLMTAADLRVQSSEFLAALTDAVERDGSGDTDRAAWGDVRQLLRSISESRSSAGFSPTETATFIMSLKEALFSRLRSAVSDPGRLADELWATSTLLDRLALHTVEACIEAREHLIARQQQDMMELSTPVVKLWDGILALPMIGTLDSARTPVVMEALLQRIVDTGAEVAIIDITGVPTVDTLVAQHLIKTVTAARLMGADCIISGIRPQIAATIVHLGVDLADIATKATLADAFRMALTRTGYSLGPARTPGR